MDFTHRQMANLRSLLERELPGKSKGKVQDLAEKIRNELLKDEMNDVPYEGQSFSRLMQAAHEKFADVGRLFSQGGIAAELSRHGNVQTFVNRRVAAKTCVFDLEEMRRLVNLFLKMTEPVLFITSKEASMYQWTAGENALTQPHHCFLPDEDMDYRRPVDGKFAEMVEKAACVVVMYPSSNPKILQHYTDLIGPERVLNLMHVQIEVVG